MAHAIKHGPFINNLLAAYLSTLNNNTPCGATLPLAAAIFCWRQASLILV
jgi:hypothetical protein